MLVDVFHRVLDGDDMAVALPVDPVDDARQRRGFAAAGGAGDQYHAVAEAGEIHNHARYAQILGVRQAEGHHAQRGRHGAALVVDVAAEAAQAQQREGKVVVALLVQLVDIPVRHFVGFVDQCLRSRRFDDFVRQGHHGALDLAGHVRARDDEYVRTIQFVCFFQQLFQFHVSSVVAVRQWLTQLKRAPSPRGFRHTAQSSVRTPSVTFHAISRPVMVMSIGRNARTAAA